MLDIFNQEKLIPSNCDLKIRLIPNRPEFCLMAKDENVKYKYEITNARLYIRSKEIAPSKIAALETGLVKRNWEIKMNSASMKSVTITSGSRSAELDNVYSGKLPTRILLAMVPDEAVSGKYSANPFYLHHQTLEYLQLKVNGEPIPRVPFTPNFPSNFTRDYIDGCLAGLGMDVGDKCFSLTPENWGNGNTFYVLKINPGPLGIDTLPLTGTIRIEMKFKDVLTKNLSVILMSESSLIDDFDRYRNLFMIK
jgi:hypothetical protein